MIICSIREGEKMKKIVILWGALLISCSSFAVVKPDVHWMELDGRLNFSDGHIPTPACVVDQAIMCHFTYLGVEYKGDDVVKAYLSEDPGLGPSLSPSKIDFTPDQLGRLQFIRDSQNRVWVKQFEVSGKQVVWLLNHTCLTGALGVPIKSIINKTETYTFDTEGLGETVLSTASVCGNFQGLYKDDKPFTGSFSFVQQKYTNVDPIVE